MKEVLKYIFVFIYGLVFPFVVYISINTLFSWGCIHCPPIFSSKGLIYLFLVITLASGIYIVNKHGLKNILLLVLIVGIGLSFWFTFETHISTQESYHISAATRRVIPDLRQVQIAMEFYFDEHGSYPFFEGGCQDITILNDFLVPDFTNSIPTAHEFQENEYKVAVSTDGDSYIITGDLYDNRRVALDNDSDGIVLGCDCNDPVYCVSP